MSRIGKLPINIPSGVNVTYKDNVVTVKGPKGELTQSIDPSIIVNIEDGKIVDAKFKTFGCGAAVATSSMATELVKG